MISNYPTYYNGDGDTSGLDLLSRKRIQQTIGDLIGIAICFIAFGIVIGVTSPKIRYFTCDMSDVSYPKIDDTIPFYAVAIYGTIGPIIIIIFVELFNAKIFPCQSQPETFLQIRLRKLSICLFHGISLFVFGIGIVLLLTEIGKRWVGRLRPHFLAVCNPSITQINCITNAATGSIYNAIYTGGSFCNGVASDVEEARLSFPSGHTSYSTYTMTFLIIYLEARLFLLRLRFVKATLQVTALIAAYVTSVSRIADYHHRGTDVIGGAVLGISIAILLTIYVGSVLWDYDRQEQYSDFDLKPT